MLFLFLVTIAASSTIVQTARDVRRHTQAGEEDWAARSVAEVLQSSIRVDIPTAYQKELGIALRVPGTNSLPGFDPGGTVNSLPVYDPTAWRFTFGAPASPGGPPGSVVMTGSQMATSGSGRTSLLGDLNAWLGTHKPIAVAYAATHGYTSTEASVAFLEEAYRQPETGAPANAEPAYVVRFAADGRAGTDGRFRIPGIIMLPPADAPCSPPVISSFTANPSPVSAGQTVTLSWNVANAVSVTLS
ncbi:MAG: hypothetical protein ACREDR_39160, partial [Blastocatellia bacterium]